MRETLIGVTDRTVFVFIPDSASTVGKGKTGLVAANLTVSYTRVETDNDVVVTDVTSSLNDLSALTDAHNDWGLKEVSSTLAAGLYRLDIADAVFASGAWQAVVYVCVTSGLAAASPIQFDLVAFNPLDSVRLGLTALPNAAAGANGGLPLGDASGNVKLQATTHTSAVIPTVTTLTGHTPQTGDNFARLGAPAGASVSADVAAVKAQTAAIETDTAEIGVAGAGLTNIDLPNQTMNITGNITGNLSGSVGSVTAGVTLAASAVQAIWDALTSAMTTVGSIGKLLVDNINAAISSRSSHSAADVWSVTTRRVSDATNITSTGGTTVPQTGDSFARIGANGASLSAVPWNAAWDAEVESEVADALEAVIADSIPADGSRPSVKQALYMLAQFMTERSVSGTTVTVRKPDGSTALFTLTLDSATAPTSTTRAT